MRLRLMPVAFLLAVGVVVAPRHVSAQMNCVQDAGNVCLTYCGTFTNTNYDVGWGKGEYDTYSTGVICPGGCNYTGPNVITYSNGAECSGGVGEEGFLVPRRDIQQLEEIAEGRPVLVVSCAGRLLALGQLSASQKPPLVSVHRRQLPELRDLLLSGD
jgi:hypothetical protein